MVIQRTIVGSLRVELQNNPIILPTAVWENLDMGDRQKLTNPALDYSVISWDGDILTKITPSAAYEGAFAQYRTRVSQELDINVPVLAIIGLA